MKRNQLGLTAAAVAMLMLILDSRAAADAAAAGMEACIRTVIPALFPFFLLSGYLTGSLGSGNLSLLIAKIFGASRNCGGIILAGLVGGYPVGARLAAQGFRDGRISREQADRLLLFCSQAGPSFLFGIAAVQLGGISCGALLWVIQILSAWMVACLFAESTPNIPIQDRIRQIKWNDAMESSLSAMGSVCGWVIVFSVIIRFLSRWVLWLFPEWIRVLLCGLLELTNGCLLLGLVEDPKLRFLVAVILLNFGGVCVVMQTASVAQGLDIRRYFLGKTLQTLFSVLLCLTLWGQVWFFIPIVLVFFIKLSGIYRIRGSNLRRVGV